MREVLPLFTLASVLFPGEALPLCAFEERHRCLVRDVLDGPGPGCVGVIAVREGSGSGAGGVRDLHEIGCTAALRRVKELGDGRFVLVSVGAKRFRLAGLDRSGSYPRGEVDLLGEDTGDELAARLIAPAVQRAFCGYVDALAGPGFGPVKIPDLSGDPVGLSCLVAETMILDLPVKQGLLAEPDALRRLATERALLARKTTMLHTFGSTPAPGLRHSRYSAN